MKILKFSTEYLIKNQIIRKKISINNGSKQSNIKLTYLFGSKNLKV